MNPFKTGDRVRSIESFYPLNFPNGTLATVTRTSGSEVVAVISDADYASPNPYEWFVRVGELELVTEPTR